jgi:serine/threonine protein kinase
MAGWASCNRAHDEVLDRDVAVKVLHPRYMPTTRTSSVVSGARPVMPPSLHHPNIVTIYDTGVDDATGSDFIVMQLVDGEDLDRLIDR